MGWSKDSVDAKRRYESGYYQGRADRKAQQPYNEQGATSDDWIDGYYAGYNGHRNKYDGPTSMLSARWGL